MEEHEKCHYESFVKCQELFKHYHTLSSFCERCYVCETCNRPFDRLKIAFERLFPLIQNAVSEKCVLPSTYTHYDHIYEYLETKFYFEAVSEAKAVLRKAHQVLQRGLRMAEKCSVLTTKFDVTLMKEFRQNELRVTKYPRAYDARVPYLEIVDAFAKYFDVYVEKKQPFLIPTDNIAFLHESDPDGFLANKRLWKWTYYEQDGEDGDDYGYDDEAEDDEEGEEEYEGSSEYSEADKEEEPVRLTNEKFKREVKEAAKLALGKYDDEEYEEEEDSEGNLEKVLQDVTREKENFFPFITEIPILADVEQDWLYRMKLV